MTQNQEELLILGIVLAFVLWPRQTSTGVTIRQVCVYPDGTPITVNLGDECPFDSTHGGASILAQKCLYPDGTPIYIAAGDECPFDSSHGGASSPVNP